MKFTSSGIGSLRHEPLILELRLLRYALPSIPYQNISKDLFIAIPVTHYITSGYHVKITRRTKRQKNKIGRDRASGRTRHGRDVGITRPII